jgi:hypothetical protein
MVFTKAKQWEYEEELRSINSHFTDNNSRKVPFLKEDIRAIYMGVNCDESTRVEIVEIANLVFDGKITLFQGELSDSNFEIVWKEMK